MYYHNSIILDQLTQLKRNIADALSIHDKRFKDSCIRSQDQLQATVI